MSNEIVIFKLKEIKNELLYKKMVNEWVKEYKSKYNIDAVKKCNTNRIEEGKLSYYEIYQILNDKNPSFYSSIRRFPKELQDFVKYNYILLKKNVYDDDNNFYDLIEMWNEYIDSCNDIEPSKVKKRTLDEKMSYSSFDSFVGW